MNDGTRHNRDCTSSFGAMRYDLQCVRCTKIKKVIMLKRKNLRNGCSQEETVAAMMLARRLVEDYELTRGEVFDREYDPEMLAARKESQRRWHQQYGPAGVRRPKGFKKLHQYFQQTQDLDDSVLSDE